MTKELIKPMRKPVPEGFGMTWVQYLNAVATVEVERRLRDKLCRRWTTIIMVVAWPLAIGLSIWLSQSGRGIASVLVLIGALVGSAYVPTALGEFYKNQESSDIARMREAIRHYEDAVERHERAQQEYWKSLRGTRFERALAGLYKKIGYSVRQTKASGDQGIDLILTHEGKTIIVQCKGHEKPVGVGAVRDLYGTMMHSGADSAVLACPAGFTKAVVDFVRNKPIQLVSARELVEMAEGAPT